MNDFFTPPPAHQRFQLAPEDRNMPVFECVPAFVWQLWCGMWWGKVRPSSRTRRHWIKNCHQADHEEAITLARYRVMRPDL